jgi:HAD superfamily hydrolase (TIGR01509 family)
VIAVVFDFDGVLAHTEPLHLAAFRDAFACEGWALSDEAYYQRYLGFNDRETIVEFERDHNIAPSAERTRALLDRKSAAYRRRLASDNVLYPGAPACVARLAAAFPLAIASGSLHAEIEDILAVANLRGPFTAIVGADDVARSKPAPDPYLAAAAALGVDPSVCVAIEDSSWGITSARTAGMKTIALTTTAPVANLAGANRIVSGLDEISVEFVRALASAAHA